MCVVYDSHLATAPQHIPTQQDMLPQHLVCKYELNCEYCNINLARNKAPCWWSDKIETCRSVLKCFMWNYMCIRWLINWSDERPCFTPIQNTRQNYSTIHSNLYFWVANWKTKYSALKDSKHYLPCRILQTSKLKNLQSMRNKWRI